MMRKNILLSGGFIALLAAVMLTGCEKSEPSKEAPKASPQPAEATAGDTTHATGHDELHALLAKADLADGKEDHIVSKCAGCALGMDGKAEHSAEAHGYALHFCSAACKEHSTEDVDKTIMALAGAGG